MLHSREFPPDDRSGPEARRFLRSHLEGRGVETYVPELLLSELVGNAIRHARTAFVVRVVVGEVVRVEVQDGNSVVPTLQAAKGDEEAGRGLLLLDALARDWGIDEVDGGKRVWFEYSPD